MKLFFEKYIQYIHERGIYPNHIGPEIIVISRPSNSYDSVIVNKKSPFQDSLSVSTLHGIVSDLPGLNKFWKTR